MSELKIGLQLYSIRDKMEADMDAALKAVKEMGYDYVEMAGYFGKTAEEIAEILKKYDLKCFSVHQGLDFYLEKGQEGIDFIKGLGAKYSAIPWYQAETLKSDLDGCIELFGKVGKTLSENGIQMLYHNHDFEFDKINDECIIDLIYSGVDNKYLKPEFDTCWIKYAGYEPTEYLEKYKDLIDVVHIKDFWCEKLANGPVYALIDNDGNEIKSDSDVKRDFEFRPVGSGIQDVKAIVDKCKEIGAEYIVVEQDAWYEGDSMECAKQSIDYLKSIM